MIWKVLASTALYSFTKSMSLMPIVSRLPQRLMRGDAVLGGDGLAVVPFEAIAEREGPDRLVGRDLVLVDHLRLDGVALVGCEQRVVDQIAVVARDVGSRPDRIEDRQIAVLHELQDLALGQRRAGTCQHGAGGQRRESASHHLFIKAPPVSPIEEGRPRPALVEGARAGAPRASLYFFEMFQNTGTGADHVAVDVGAHAPCGEYHWPRLTWVGYSDPVLLQVLAIASAWPGRSPWRTGRAASRSLVARPAEHRLVASGVEEAGHHRIEDVGGDPRGQEGVPAALVERVLLGRGGRPPSASPSTACRP